MAECKLRSANLCGCGGSQGGRMVQQDPSATIISCAAIPQVKEDLEMDGGELVSGGEMGSY